MENALRIAVLCLLAGAFGHPMEDPSNLYKVDWWNLGQHELGRSLSTRPNEGVAKNVILFIGAGMGMTTVTAARILQAQRKEESFLVSNLAWDLFPYTSLAKTYQVDRMVPDSASAATSLLTGVKTVQGVLGVGAGATRGHCDSTRGNELNTTLNYAHQQGKWTGVVTTARVTDATPAAAYAVTADKNWEGQVPAGQPPWCKDIAAQLVEDNHYIRVMLGGGRGHFLPNNESDPEYPAQKGWRKDGRNLMKEWINVQTTKVGSEKVKLVRDTAGLTAVDDSNVDYLMGLFDRGHVPYELDRDTSPRGEPSLTEMVDKAIRVLRRSEKGFFLLVEGARIDHAHHENKAQKALVETIALSDAVTKAIELTDEGDTFIAVTGDHSQAFTMSGFAAINSNILGISQSVKEESEESEESHEEEEEEEEEEELEVQLAEDGLPYLTLSYTSGPGYLYHRTQGGFLGNPRYPRRNLTGDATTGKLYDKDYVQDAGIYTTYDLHTGEDVPVYARGPMAHLIRGTHDHTYLAQVMMYASCLGPNRKHCKQGQQGEQGVQGLCSGHPNLGPGWSGGVMVVVIGVVVRLRFLY